MRIPILSWTWGKIRGSKTETIPSPFPIEIQNGRARKLTGVPAALITANEGIVTIRKTVEASGELISNPYQKEDVIYHGWAPIVIEIHNDIFPKFVQRLLTKKRLRLRGYFNLAFEPMTRNPFTGQLLDPVKKDAVLVERGIKDQDGWLLDKDGNRKVTRGCWTKADVSDIDFIKSEFHSLKQSEAVVHAAKAMKRTGMSTEDMWKWVIIAFIMGFVAIVFIMSGGI